MGKERAAKQKRSVENANLEEDVELRHQEHAERRAEQKMMDDEKRKKQMRHQARQRQEVLEQRNSNLDAKSGNAATTLELKAEQTERCKVELAIQREEAMEAAAERKMKYEEKLAEVRELKEASQHTRAIPKSSSGGILKKQDSPTRSSPKSVDFNTPSPSPTGDSRMKSKTTKPKSSPSDNNTVHPSDHARASFMRCVGDGPIAKFNMDGTLETADKFDVRKSLSGRRTNTKQGHGRRSLMQLDAALLEIRDVNDIVPSSPSAMSWHEPLVVEEVDEDEKVLLDSLEIKSLKWIKEMQKKMDGRSV